MDLATPAKSSYSAEVRLRLLVGDDVYELTHTGPDFVRVRDEIELSPQEAIVRVIIDGSEHDRNVFLPDGVRGRRERVRVVEMASEAVPAA